MLQAMGRGVRAAPLTRRMSELEDEGLDGRLASAMDDARVIRRAVGAPGAAFGYLFPDAPGAPADPDAARRLLALADAMSELDCGPAEASSSIPAIWTVFGQFLDHDMMAAADRGGPALEAARRGAAPRSRAEVAASLVNLRDGAPRLRSLYEADAGDGPLAAKLTRLMREPGAPFRLRLDLAAPSPLGAPPLPRDGGADLLRLGRLLDPDPARGVTEAELRALPAEVRAGFLTEAGPNASRAVIGDARNDRNLPLAQFHLSMIRFHNRVADWLADRGGIAPEGLFEAARARVRRDLRRVALDAYLPRICDRRVLARIRAAGAPLYAGFAAQARAAGGARLPIPLEYAASAARFRHSMSRASVDHNRFHGRPEGGARPLQDRAGLAFLHASGGEGLGGGRLPADRVVEWARYVQDPPAFADRGARRIDTLITPPLGHEAAFRRLGHRILMRERSLNVPSGQACAEGFNRAYPGLIRPLNREELTSGHTGEAVRDGLAERTPLWFYILKEAELIGQGERLGPLGSAVAAETLIGVMTADPEARPEPRPAPDPESAPDGVEIDGVEALLRAAEML